MTTIYQKKEYKKFDLMMSVIELLKKKTGYIFRIYIENINGETSLLINKEDLNRRKIIELSKITSVDENSNTIDITKYYIEKTFGTSNIKLIDNNGSVILCTSDVQEA